MPLQGAPLGATTHAAGQAASPDLTKQPTLYVVGYAHLDTEWRWEYPQVIREFLPKTLHDNFVLFEKYPHYIFNFSGANRYRMIKEYYPSDYATLKKWVDSGRWFLAGSSMEESDVNSPNAESIFRQILYGNEYFRKEFGHASAEYMLPDCFGFPETLPGILAHAGIKGFSTQKLTWGAAAPVGGPGSPEDTPVGIPFNVGIWKGPDGKGVIAALNPGSYGGDISYDLSKTPPAANEVDWVKRIQLDGKASGLLTDYHYYGTGDTGGAPRESSVKLLEAIVTKSPAVLPPPRRPRFFEPQEAEPPAGLPVLVGDGPVHVVSSTAEQMFLDILKSGKQGGLPVYQGDLELTNHSAGSLTSETYQKRWNRKNELLAQAAETASVAAAWLGGRVYPQQRLNRAWALVLGGQFHDIMAGTATPKAYEFSWNDDVIAMNQFAEVLTSATEAVASKLDTDVKGAALVVYNPLPVERQDVVEAAIPPGLEASKGVRVFGPDGKRVPAQVEGSKVLFLATAPSSGYAVYDVQPGGPPDSSAELKVTDSSLENARYRIAIDQDGDVSSIFDKKLHKELLASPVRLAFQAEKPTQWPAWNMDWDDQRKPPRGYVSGPAQIRITENGPVRVAVTVSRESEGSKFVQTIRLSAGGAGDRVEFGNVIDWKTGGAALKATFPLTASNSVATYNWDVATIQRTNNDERKFEVPSHQFIDLTDKSGAYGVTILTDCKNGSDKPDDNTLRLTLLYSPGISEGGRGYSDQATQDWGHHEFVYGLAAHSGDWRTAQTDWQALRLNQPLIAFESSRHRGPLGKSFSLVHLNNSRVRVMAVKKAEDSNEVIVRMVEVDGKRQRNVRVSFAGPIAAAREVNGQEQPVGEARVVEGSLVTDFTPYQIRTFALSLRPARVRETTPRFASVKLLPYNRDVESRDGEKSSGGFDSEGRSLPAEMLPAMIGYDGIEFALASGEKPDAVIARGQSIPLPAGKFNRLYILAAATDGDQKAAFKIGDRPAELNVEDWSGYIGQWDNRTWITKEVPNRPRRLPPNIKPDSPLAKRIAEYFKQHPTRKEMEYTGLTPGFIKRAPLAWYASHRHTANGENEPYAYSYLLAYTLEIPAGAKTLTLPDNDKIRVLAVTAAEDREQLTAAQPLYDTLSMTR